MGIERSFDGIVSTSYETILKHKSLAALCDWLSLLDKLLRILSYSSREARYIIIIIAYVEILHELHIVV